jgi:5-methylcytosine-specific restriction enzyme subunit McrC
MTEIPIQNVYYLLCYAWDQMEAGQIVETGARGHTELADLFAQMLVAGTQRVLRQGLDRGYVTTEEATSRIRGRIDFGTSLKQAHLPRAQAHCHYDELSRNVLHNRILRSTVKQLLGLVSLKDRLRDDLRRLDRRLDGIDPVPLTASVFSRVQLHAGNAFYRFLMNVCELIQQQTVPREGGEGQRFRDFRRDDATMWKVFERFVYNFYRHEQDEYSVERPQVTWDFDGLVPKETRQRFPGMQTDVVLEPTAQTPADRALIIDTKFYGDTLQAHHGRQSYHSANLYQLFAYLKNAEAKGEPYAHADGLLLYPTTEHEIEDAATIQDHKIRIGTINLAQDWSGIRRDLLQLIKETPTEGEEKSASVG